MTSSNQGVKIIFGTGSLGNSPNYKDLSSVQKCLELLESNDIRLLDSARLYGNSEVILGEAQAGKNGRFNIDTKHPGGFVAGTASHEQLLKEGLESLERLKMDKVDVYFIHAPDTSIPWSSQLAGINDLYKRGAFKRFGLSNFTPEQVQEVYDHCKEKDYPLPTVYQGNYNPVARHYEKTLFPLLRKLGIAFYAYSPIAGGFLTKTKQQIEDGEGRFDTETLGGTYRHMYRRTTLLEALDDWTEVAREESIKPAALAYRWVRFNSILSPDHDDAIIFAARNMEQVEETIQSLKEGPLSEKACKRIDEIWEKVQKEAPTDNYAQ